jgi:hypothetical protein
MDNDRTDGLESAPEDDRTERERSFSRRAIVRAGWSVPVILAVAPTVAFAASGVVHLDHTDSTHADHTDSTHQDSTVSDHALKRSIETLGGALGALRAL